MLLFLSIFTFSSKFEVPLQIRHDGSCPLTHESYILINGSTYIKPSSSSIFYLRLHPGQHDIKVLHPWCDFRDVSISVADNGKYTASSGNERFQNGSPVISRHEKNFDPMDITNFLSPQTVIVFVGGFLLIQQCKKKMSSPEFIAQMREQQELMKRQQQLQQQQKKRN